MNNHPFHLVDKSPWPIVGATGLFTFTSGTAVWFHKNSMEMMMLGTIIVLFTMIQWWRDAIREATFQGLHTITMILSMKMGMIMFIVLKILFFMSFFLSKNALF